MAPNRFSHIFVFIFVILQSCDFSAGDNVLPKTIVPNKYDLTVSIDSDTLSYSVKEIVHLDVQQISPNISIHSAPSWKIKWGNVTFTCGQQKLTVKKFSLDYDVVTLAFETDIAKGNCTLEMIFADNVPLKDTLGIYISPNSQSIITQFQPNLTHNVFPCFDEPTFKAKFALTIQHSKKYTALSSTRQLNSTCSDETGLCITRFPETLRMAPSSFGFSLTLDTAQSRQVDSINYRVFGPIANKDKDTAYKWAIDWSSSALSKAQLWLKRDYQLKQIDFESVQNLNATNDNSWGLIKIREPLLNYNASNPFDTPIEVYQKSSLAIIDGVLSGWLEHEITPNGDEAVYVNRGLSKYIQYLIIDQLKPDWQIMDQFVVHELQLSLANAQLEPGIVSNAEKSAGSSASIIRMIVSTVGTNAFQNAIQHFSTSFSMSTVLPANLFNAIQEEVNKDEQIKLPASVQQIFKDWVKTRDAVPSIRVWRRYDNSSTANITSVGPASLKFIPIALASALKAVPDSVLWLTPNAAENNSYEIAANDSQWLLVNNQATGGYYRVLYDNTNWQLLIELLKSKNYEAIHVQNRAQLIDDAVHFAQNGLLSHDIVFELLTYLQKERELIPWESAKRSLQFYDRMLRGVTAYPHFQGLISKITADFYSELSVTNQNEQNHLKRLERLSVAKLACEAGEKHCITEIDKMAEDIVSQKKYIIPELQQVIFCAASRHILKPGSKLESSVTTYVLGMFQKKNRTDDESMARAAYGLGCTQNEENINKALTISTTVFPPAFNIEIRAADREMLFKAIAVGSYAGTKAALKYMNQKYLTMKKLYVSIPSVLDTIAPYITSVELNTLFEDFVKAHFMHFDEEMNSAASRTNATARFNKDWTVKHVDGMSKWLVANIEVSSSTALTMNFALIVTVTLFAVFLRH